MISFVVDASVLVELTLGTAPDPSLQRRAMSGRGGAPELIDLEALNALRRLTRAGAVDRTAAEAAAGRLAAAPIARVSHRPLLARAWALRDTLSAGDAAYVALAERFGVPLLTCDARLGHAHGHDAEVLVYARS